MNKVELVAAIATRAELSKKDTEKVIAAFQETVMETLSAGDKVQLVGFGTFEVTERAAREGRNPSTGETMLIGPSKTPKFKAGKNFKASVNVK